MSRQPALLLVEDDSQLSEVLGVRLGASGYVLRAAQNVADGIAALKSNAPDLVIIDVMLPDGSGYQILDEVRTNPDLQNIPVIVLTGLGTPQQVEEGLKRGANTYLTKPYDSLQLVSEVERLLHDSS